MKHLPVVLAVASLTLGACGGGGSSSGDTAPTLTPTPTPASNPEPQPSFPDGFWRVLFSGGDASVYHIQGENVTSFYTPDFEAAEEWNVTAGTFDDQGIVTGSLAEFTSVALFTGDYDAGMVGYFTDARDGKQYSRDMPLLGLTGDASAVAALNLPFDEVAPVFPEGIWFWQENGTYLVIDGPSFAEYGRDWDNGATCYTIEVEGTYDYRTGATSLPGLSTVFFTGSYADGLTVTATFSDGSGEASVRTAVAQSDFDSGVANNICP